jgi:hypothetical protein
MSVPPVWWTSQTLPCTGVRRADDLAAEGLADRLVAEADAEHRHARAARRAIRARQMPASFGVQGPGESTIASGCRASEPRPR